MAFFGNNKIRPCGAHVSVPQIMVIVATVARVRYAAEDETNKANAIQKNLILCGQYIDAVKGAFGGSVSGPHINETAHRRFC